MELCQSKRGELQKMEYISPERLELVYRLPLAEVVIDFFDQMKSRSQGYASMDYDPDGYSAADLVKVDILLHGEPVDAFSAIVHREFSYEYGRKMSSKLQELIPRQQFDVPIQAAISGRIIARQTVKAYRKDVTAKLYGGDVTRKNKLLKKQKEGKTTDEVDRQCRRAPRSLHLRVAARGLTSEIAGRSRYHRPTHHQKLHTMPDANLTLTERKAAILQAVVESYIATSEPVGSSHIVKTAGLDVSSATVRSDMVALEEAGYLQQPHTSAGRVPSDKGYRYFVDSLMEPHAVGATEQRKVSSFFGAAQGELERMLSDTSTFLAQLTDYAAVDRWTLHHRTQPAARRYRSSALLMTKP